MTLVKLQLGKKGLTNEFIENLRKIFLTSENVRISLLKSSTRDKQEAKQIAENIIKNIEGNFRYNIIGYTIVMRKLRRAR